MVWDSTKVTQLLLTTKSVGIDLANSICQKLDLGQSITKDIDFLYQLNNIVFALTYATDDVYVDLDYALLNEMVNRIKTQRNRYRVI